MSRYSFSNADVSKYGMIYFGVQRMLDQHGAVVCTFVKTKLKMYYQAQFQQC